MDSFEKGFLAIIFSVLAFLLIFAFAAAHHEQKQMKTCGQICENGVKRFDHGDCFCK